jgi:vacuolar-type H+-ATPase subunit F/Vma7
MKTLVRVLCRPDVAAGFALAGMRAVPAPNAAVATLRLGELVSQPDMGVLLVEERLHDALPVDVRRRLARRALPMVVPFPGPAWVERAEGAEAYVIELLRQVIGYRVRLR